MKELIAYETFRCLPKIRFFDNIQIDIDFPHSKVTFDKIDFELASRIVGLQFLGGYNNKDSINRVIYLNNLKIDNISLFVWNEDNNLMDYIKENKNNLKIKNNTYRIYVNKIDQILYIKQTVIEWLD